MNYFHSISLVFGIITILAGVLGVVSGSLMGQKLRVRFPTADAVICGIGMLCSAPLFYGGIMLAIGPLEPVYALFFFAMWFLCLNWALVGDMLLVWTFVSSIPPLFVSQILKSFNLTVKLSLLRRTRFVCFSVRCCSNTKIHCRSRPNLDLSRPG